MRRLTILPLLLFLFACGDGIQNPEPLSLEDSQIQLNQDLCEGPTGNLEPCPGTVPLATARDIGPANSGLPSVAVYGTYQGYLYLDGTGMFSVTYKGGTGTTLAPNGLYGYDCVLARLDGNVPEGSFVEITRFATEEGGGYIGEWWGAGAAHSGLGAPLVMHWWPPNYFLNFFSGDASDGYFLGTGTPINVTASHPVTAGLPATFSGGSGTEFFVRPVQPLDSELTELATHDGFGSTQTALAVGEAPGGGNAVLMYFDASDPLDDPGSVPELATLYRNAVSFACSPGIEIEIDLKPGSYPNCVNPGKKGVTPVAILTSDVFDATTVDPGTVLVEGVSPLRWAVQDVDGDGDLDLVFHFRSAELEAAGAFAIDGGEFILTGSLKAEFGGTPFSGYDIVNIAGEEVCETADMY